MEPGYEDYLLPVLKVMADREIRTNAEIRTLVLDLCGLDVTKLVERQTSTGNLKYKDNMNFAMSYLFMAGLLNRIKNGTYVITESGLTVVNRGMKEINYNFLCEISPTFKERMDGHHKRNNSEDNKAQTIKPSREEKNPIERIDDDVHSYKTTKMTEMLSILTSVSDDKQINRDRDDAFEHLCLKLLTAMGYGVTGYVTKKSGDGGIDGIIIGDKLGFEKIAYQSKRWNNPVGRREVSQFVTDFDFAGCTKGVFITTSSFQTDALKLAETKKNLILIDGEKLVDLMYEYGVGVQTKTKIEVKDLDADFFEEMGF